jgi:small basic protein
MKRFFITSIVSLVLGLILGLVAGRRMPPSHEQVANYLSNLSMSDFSEFAKRMNAQLGFQAFPQHFVPAVPTVPAEPSR